MDLTNARPDPASRWSAGALALLLQSAVIIGLIGAFAPGYEHGAAQADMTSVDITREKPLPPKTRFLVVAVKPAGATGPSGRLAAAMAVSAPRPAIELAAPLAPPSAATGHDAASAAREAGAGTGFGNGANGTGQGGGGKPFKLTGDINSARDYPIASRDLRIGDYAIIVLTVGIDGRASACRVQRASRDAAADAITCSLAVQRFRFRPGSDGAGNPVESRYGWKQSWHF
jgi:protein TonB